MSTPHPHPHPHHHKHPVPHGAPTPRWTDRLHPRLSWRNWWTGARPASNEVFAPGAQPGDIYAIVFKQLGPYGDTIHRRAVMLEVLRVLAEYETGWDWNGGIDQNTDPNKPAAEGRGGAVAGQRGQRRPGPPAIPLQLLSAVWLGGPAPLSARSTSARVIRRNPCLAG